MEAAKCPKCGSGMKHRGTMTTLVGYVYPERHNHDDNCQSRWYFCECGHEEIVSKRNRCPACDWVGEAYCFCHPGKKVDVWPEDTPLEREEVDAIPKKVAKWES